MRILFYCPDIEDPKNKARGIGGILKSLVIAAKDSGHEIGLLTAHPDVGENESRILNSKVRHIYLWHYLNDGYNSFKYITKKKLSKKHALVELAKMAYRHDSFLNIDPELLHENSPSWVKRLDYTVNSPYLYQMVNFAVPKLPNKIMKKITSRYKIDLLICLSPDMITKKSVSRKTKIAHFIHDMMPIELVETPPDNATPRIFAKKMLSTIKNGGFLLANSTDTANKILEISPKKHIDILYGTMSTNPKEVGGSTILNQQNLKPKEFLLFVSMIERRKNLETLFDAYTKIYETNKIPLVIVGAKGYGWKAIEAKYKSLNEDVRQNIRFLGYVSEADKYELYKNALLFAFPSVYEGLGLMLIEAMTYGLPVVTTDRGALRECGGDAAEYIANPYDAEEIADKIIKVIEDKDLRKSMILKGYAQSKKFTQEEFDNKFKKFINYTISRP